MKRCSAIAGLVFASASAGQASQASASLVRCDQHVAAPCWFDRSAIVNGFPDVFQQWYSYTPPLDASSSSSKSNGYGNSDRGGAWMSEYRVTITDESDFFELRVDAWAEVRAWLFGGYAPGDWEYVDAIVSAPMLNFEILEPVRYNGSVLQPGSIHFNGGGAWVYARTPPRVGGGGAVTTSAANSVSFRFERVPEPASLGVMAAAWCVGTRRRETR